MGAFKVKEFAKYEFKPAVVVAEISDIYLNLAHSESFCEAVSGDGRSYSPKLFPQTVTVLNKIHHPFDKIQQFTELGHTIEASVHQFSTLLFVSFCIYNNFII